MKHSLLPLALTALTLACTSLPGGPVSRNFSPAGGSDLRSAVVASGKNLLGLAPDSLVTVNGRQFMLDCIGTLSAAWWGAGYDLQKEFPRYTGNGVLRLYNSLKDHAALAPLAALKPGDIVFWENTYDRNGDGKLYNDGITHAGMVVSVDDDGTVAYLHESVTRGVVISYLNTLHPDTAFSPTGKLWNSPMFLGSGYGKPKNPPHWLSGDLVKAFADAEKTAAAYR